jgi:hypothetical protein
LSRLIRIIWILECSKLFLWLISCQIWICISMRQDCWNWNNSIKDLIVDNRFFWNNLIFLWNGWIIEIILFYISNWVGSISILSIIIKGSPINVIIILPLYSLVLHILNYYFLEISLSLVMHLIILMAIVFILELLLPINTICNKLLTAS